VKIYPPPDPALVLPERHVDASAFSPLSISNILLWLRADLGVTLTTGKVSTWADQSGQGNDVTQGTAGNRPTVTANSQNGQPGITFAAASNTFLARNPLTSAPAREPFSIYAVSKLAVANQQGGIIDVTTAGGNTNTGDLLIQNSTNRDYRYASALDLQYAFSSTAAAMNVATVKVTGVNQEEKELFEKTVSKGTQATATATGTALTQVRVGRLFNEVFPWDGDILEIACYTKQLSATEIGQLATYATARYAL
jgi:hypothetical protein